MTNSLKDKEDKKQR